MRKTDERMEELCTIGEGISERTHSTPQRLPNMCLTQPLPPALTDSQVFGVVYMYKTNASKIG